MTAKNLLSLAAITLAVVLMAMITANYANLGDAIEERGQAVVPGLAGKANSVALIEVDSGDGPTTIIKKSGKFQDAEGYPAKPSVVTSLIQNLALLTIEERKTADASRFGELELKTPGDKASSEAGERVVLKDASGGVIADLIVGARDYTVGGTRGGQFVRRTSSDQSYLVRGSVSPPVSRVNWFETTLGDVKAADIRTVKATAGKQMQYEFQRVGADLALQGLPDGRKLDAAKRQRVERLFGPIAFTNVRAKPDDAPAITGPVLAATTKDGLTVTLSMVAPADDAPKPNAEAGAEPPKADQKDPNAGWVRITANATSPAAKAAADALAKKVEGFEFRFSSNDTELFSFTTPDFIEQPPS